MKIENVEFHYLADDVIRNIGDGSQDALLVRVIMDDGSEGWGECEAAPLVSIAAWCCPMSHLACKPLKDTVLGFEINTPEDIARLTNAVRSNSFDLLQSDHTLSGIDIALWDMLGRKAQVPVWKLLGYEKAFPKTAYASQLFGDTPQETYEKGLRCRKEGFRAAKFGWGPFGLGEAAQDIEHLRAAREGVGDEVALMIDAGTVWGSNTSRAAEVIPELLKCRAVWLEEPFTSGALKAYAALSELPGCAGLMAGGEGAHNPDMAKNLIDFGKVGFIQIDTGRIGGITSAKEVADYALQRGVTFVNHTFTTSLALSASIQPFAGMKDSCWCEFPVESAPPARKLTTQRLLPDADGMIALPDAPGLGVEINFETLERYGRKVKIEYEDNVIWEMK
ncbi:MAG: mandelate racemase/muconate lactonizing enzyme family protein [Lentisphaeria bacterium]|nr:mandelate racemase/muconate lactonizing enzyme family protein [Lentisphaeria bacterium]